MASDSNSCTAPTRAIPWPDNRPAARLALITAKSLALTFGEPPKPGGPYAHFTRRCYDEYRALASSCDRQGGMWLGPSGTDVQGRILLRTTLADPR